MEFERISWKAILLWELLAALALCLLVTLTVLIFVPYTWLWYLLLWVLGALYVLTAFLYFPLLYLNIGYAVCEKAIVYRSGVLFKSTRILYRDRIAFVTVYNTPFTPLLHISTFVASAAGGTLRIFFMNADRAEALSELLSKDIQSKDILSKDILSLEGGTSSS